MQRTGSSPTTLMTLGYAFNAARGFPNSRTNSMFSWSESFSYDNLDRLTVFNDNNGSHMLHLPTLQAQSVQDMDPYSTKWELYVHGGMAYRIARISKDTPPERV